MLEFKNRWFQCYKFLCPKLGISSRGAFLCSSTFITFYVRALTIELFKLRLLNFTVYHEKLVIILFCFSITLVLTELKKKKNIYIYICFGIWLESSYQVNASVFIFL